MTKIKNCGLKTPEAIDQAIATRASFIGLVHHESSPRHVSLAQMKTLIAHAAGRIKTVAVLVNPNDTLLHEIVAAGPDYIQLHDVPSPARIQEVAALAGKPIISAIAVSGAHDLALSASLEEISSHLLFDAPRAGSGHAFDWSVLKNLPLKKPWFLAGGLNTANVAEAIRLTHAPMVDVSSGLEDPVGSGNKSLEMIASFNAAVLGEKKWDGFYARTMHLPQPKLTEAFLSFLPAMARVLDFGAGSGAWSAAFLRDRPDLSIDVLDQNIESASALPGEFSGKRIKQSFQDFRAGDAYEAIWARSVLFFLPPQELSACFHQLSNALTHGGIFAFTMVEACDNASLCTFHGMTDQAIRNMLDDEGFEILSMTYGEFPYTTQRIVIPTYEVFARKS